jgi:steroid 5-alpha reductase family enzyme
MFVVYRGISGFRMIASFIGGLILIAVSLPGPMAMVQQRTGNSGWADAIWTFSLRLTGVASALWPIAGGAPNSRQWLVAVWSLRLGSHIAVRTAGFADDPRHAAFAGEWGVNSPRRMFFPLPSQKGGLT